MKNSLLVGLALLLVGCVAAPRYQDPLASVTKKEGLFVSDFDPTTCSLDSANC